MINRDILKEVREYVILFLTENLSDQMTFHSINHTFEVVSASTEIAMQSEMSEDEYLILQVSAWFHDSGYVYSYKGHEEESKKIANVFLQNIGCGNDFIDGVLKCINATKYPQNPVSEIEKVLCDADMYHLTKPNYSDYQKALRIEFEKCMGLIFTDDEWGMENDIFLKNHTFHTEYGNVVLSKLKELNFRRMSNSNNI